MKVDIKLAKSEPAVNIRNSVSGNMFVVIEDYTAGSGFDILAGTMILNVHGAFIAFLADGDLRIWENKTVEKTPSAIINLLKVRRALPGESVTLSVPYETPVVPFGG